MPTARQKLKKLSPEELHTLTQPTFDPRTVIEYFGVVNYGTSERVLNTIKEHMIGSPEEPLTMIVTSAGGPSGTAMSFYDTIRNILKPNLITVGSGDVDSSGIIIFLTGSKRYVTPHTTLLLHRAGRVFDGGQRFTPNELAGMIAEDTIKDSYYASIIAKHSNSNGALTQEDVLTLMEKNTILTPSDLIHYGLADEILREQLTVS